MPELSVEQSFMSFIFGLLEQNQVFRQQVSDYLENLQQVEANNMPQGLLKVAMEYANSKEFCYHELDLPIRIANALSRAGYTPAEVVTATEKDLLNVRNLGVIGVAQVIDARNNWKPFFE